MPKLVLLVISYLLFTTSSTHLLYADFEEFRQAFSQAQQNANVYTLNNGLRVVFYRRGEAPVFSGAVIVRLGGSDEVLGETGISHLLEHMAFKGTPTIGTKDYTKEKEYLDELEEIAVRAKPDGSVQDKDKDRWDEIHSALKKIWIMDHFSGEYDKRGASGMNATTHADYTRYFVSFPRTAFEFWCMIESERIIHPAMRQFYQERDVVLEERRMNYEDDPSGKLYELILGTVFRMHPYRHPVIGYTSDVKRLTASTTAALQKKYYVPKNMVIGVVGDVDPETDLPVLEKYFGRIPEAPVPPRPQIIEPPQEGEKRITLEADASPELVVAYRKPNYPHPDDVPISILGEILATGKVSRLFQALVRKNSLAVSVNYFEAPGSMYPNLLFFSLTPKSPYTNQELLKVFDEQINKLITGEITQGELLRAKRVLALQHLNDLTSNMSLALNLATTELVYDNWKIYFRWIDEALKISTKDVQRVAREYLKQSTRTVAFLEKKAS